MIPRVTDLSAPAEVGRFYLVPSINVGGSIYGVGARERWWPVWATPHSDPEILPSAGNEKHYHFDQRFLSDSQMRGLRGGESGAVYGEVLWYLRLGNAVGTFQYLRRKCRREFNYPARGSEILEPKLRAYHRPIGSCRTCPHRGFDLRQVTPDERGVIVCPGHGLRWWAATGEPVAKIPPPTA